MRTKIRGSQPKEEGARTFKETTMLDHHQRQITIRMIPNNVGL